MAPDAASVADVAAFVDELAQLQSPRGRALPWRMRAFLPDPTTSFEAWERLHLLDAPRLSTHQCLHEFSRLRLAVAAVPDYLDIPAWIWRRRTALVQRLRRDAA